MGVLFECGGDVVWNPSPRVALAFVAHLRTVETILVAASAESGIGNVICDEVQVDPEKLPGFVSLLGRELELGTSNEVTSLVAGPFALAVGLLTACGWESPSFIGLAGNLARRGSAIVSGKGQRGPIYENLV